MVHDLFLSKIWQILVELNQTEKALHKGIGREDGRQNKSVLVYTSCFIHIHTKNIFSIYFVYFFAWDVTIVFISRKQKIINRLFYLPCRHSFHHWFALPDSIPRSCLPLGAKSCQLLKTLEKNESIQLTFKNSLKHFILTRISKLMESVKSDIIVFICFQNITGILGTVPLEGGSLGVARCAVE